MQKLCKTSETKSKSPYPILVIENDPVSCKLFEKILSKAGYNCFFVENGHKALDLFNDLFFPLIISSWVMPEINGIEFCRAIKKRVYKGYVYIILVTAKDSKKDIVTGLNAGADDFLSKPFNHAELLARIKAGIRILDLENSLNQATEEVRLLSITDPLTGCYNRGYLTSGMLANEISRAKRYNHPISIIFADIDKFKNVNDKYGHQTGDYVLQKFVYCINKLIRYKLDWIARYGGEEFIIVLPETEFINAFFIAERLRSSIFDMSLIKDDHHINITCSFGVTGFDESTSNEKKTNHFVIKKADEYLLKAKKNGRNRVMGEKL